MTIKPMNLKTLLGLTLVAGAMASCSLDEQEIPASELYAREFYKTFGLNVSEEGMNVVEQKSVTMSCSKPTHVKIYELQNGEYRLAAEYEDVTNKTITFDGIKGDDTSFLVNCDGAMYFAKNGATVNYSPVATRAASRGPLRTSVIPSGVTSISKNSAYTKITSTNNDHVIENLSKGDGKNSLTTGYLDLTDQVLLQVDKGNSFTFYPVYWNSKKQHTVGVYYYDSNSQKHEIDVYKDKEGDELQFSLNGDDTYTTTLANSVNCFDYGDQGTVKISSPFSFNAKGYTMTASQDVAAGIYVRITDQNGTKTYYSDKDQNPNNISHFAYRVITEGGKDYSYYAFDDPDDNGGEGDYDFNDFVMYVGAKLTPASDNLSGWTVACEDLGGTFDFDFNDVVFQVYYAKGHDYITIIPLAAGGTLPVKLQITINDNHYDISDGDWHNHFGRNKGTYNYGQMINTCFGSVNYERNVYPIKVTSDALKDFSMATYTTQKDRAGKFRLLVQHDNQEWVSVNMPGKDEKPQILVLPIDWRWPKELKRINTIYPTFGEWGTGYSEGETNNWVNNIKDADQLTEEDFYKHVVGRKAYEPNLQ